MRLIDADALYLELSREAEHCLEIGTRTSISWATALQDAKRRIRSAPPIEAEPVRHGRWETANDKTHFCSHCGCDAPYTWDDIYRSCINLADDMPDRPSNYCPNCGCKMDLEGE